MSTSRSGSVDLETLAKQAEWEQQIQSLDQKEMEHHASRMKLLTEQLSLFSRELLGLKQVIGEFQEQREKDAANVGLLQEQVRREQQDGHEEILAVVAQLQQVFADHKEEFKGQFDALQGSHGSVTGDLQRELRRREQEHAKLHDRVNSAEGLLGDSADRLAALRDSHDQHVVLFSKHYDDFEAFKGSHAQHATLPERLAFREQLVGDSVEQRSGEQAYFSAMDQNHDGVISRAEWNQAMQVSRRALSPFAQRVGNARSARSNFGGRGLDGGSHGAGEATLKARLEKVERNLGLHSDTHNSFADRHAQLESHHATLGERVQYLEKALGDSADKHETEVKALHEACRQAYTKHADDLKKLEAFQGAHATVGQRLAYVERLLGDSADNHAEEPSRNQFGRAAISPASARAVSNPILERLDCLENTVGDTHLKQSKQSTTLESLRSCHDKHADAVSQHSKDLETLMSRHSSHAGHHATLKEQVDCIETQFAEVVADIHGRIVDERGLREKHHGSLIDVLGQVRSGAAEHHATVNDRMIFLEKVVGVQSADDDNGKAIRHASVSERVDFLEQVIGSSVEGQFIPGSVGGGFQMGPLQDRLMELERRTVEETRTTNAKIDSCHNRMILLRQAWCVDTPSDTPRGR